MSSRKLNSLELKIHQAALSDTQKTLTAKELEVLVPDVNSRKDALNFLLGTGMLKFMKDAKGTASFRAVTKNEMDVKKDMSGEERMVLSHIQACGNEGIWTKHLKAKTELHQTVIDRCLKSLVQKQLVKSVKNVKHPTRKIYMLHHLDPSVEMTGGPWYTDNELDTEFIKLLTSACLHYVRDRSFPKQGHSKDNSPHSQRLFPISASPSYPTAQKIQAFLGKSKITETTLNVEHVEMLLNVLILDGEIEKVPAFGAAMWDANVDDDDQDEECEVEPTKKKRKHNSRHKSRKHSKAQSDSESIHESPKKNKKRKKDDRSDASDSDGDSDRKRSKKRVKLAVSDDDGEPKKPSKKTKKSKYVSSSSSSDSGSSSESEDEPHSRRSTTKKNRKRSASPMYDLKSSGVEAFGSAHVYRAIRQERVALGWSQAPCGRCPVFDFCKEKGPVNPTECTYYEGWLKNGVVANE